MSNKKEELSKLERALLDKEFAVIQGELSRIGGELIRVFEKYGKIDGRHGEELASYVRGAMVVGNDHYYAGYSTSVTINTHPHLLPECVKKMVLDWAIADFFEKFDQIKEVVEG